LTPLPAGVAGAPSGATLVAWRLDATRHAANWHTAEGAFLVGGRWSSPGKRVIYSALDPSTAILEVGVHKGFGTLDAVPHTLLELEIREPGQVHVLDPAKLPNPAWLRPGTISRAQQAFGDALLAAHPLVLLPSVVSTHSWNLLIDASQVPAKVRLKHRDVFALDPRISAKTI
jgi:RES domain-containing protein